MQDLQKTLKGQFGHKVLSLTQWEGIRDTQSRSILSQKRAATMIGKPYTETEIGEYYGVKMVFQSSNDLGYSTIAKDKGYLITSHSGMTFRLDINFEGTTFASCKISYSSLNALDFQYGLAGRRFNIEKILKSYKKKLLKFLKQYEIVKAYNIMFASKAPDGSPYKILMLDRTVGTSGGSTNAAFFSSHFYAKVHAKWMVESGQFDELLKTHRTIIYRVVRQKSTPYIPFNPACPTLLNFIRLKGLGGYQGDFNLRGNDKEIEESDTFDGLL